MERPAEIQRHTEKLPRPALYNLIAAVGNHEGKALVLAGMQKDRVYSGSDLKTVMTDLQGNHPLKTFDGRNLFTYCQRTFEPIGLVARAVYNSELNEVGYAKTEYGMQIGDALVGHLLSFSEQHPQYSLRSFFGATSSSAKPSTEEGFEGEYIRRASEARIKIFEELTSSPSLSIPEEKLSTMTGIYGSRLRKMIEPLIQSDLIEHRSKSADKTYTSYRLHSPPRRCL